MTRIARQYAWPALGAALLIGLYVTRYAQYAPAPGNMPSHPEGWWEWFDQGRYIESVRALAALDLSPLRHWYPLGYPVLGALFVRFSPMHPFYLPDLACLLACFAGFVTFARRIGVPACWAVPVFLVSVTGTGVLFTQWIIPWTTTPVAALVWLLLACVARNIQQGGRAGWIGLLAAAVPLVRPTEALIAGLCVLATLPGKGKALPRHTFHLVLGGLVPIVAYGALHWGIYGVARSGYMLGSQAIGFTLQGIGWKAYTILIDPVPWFLDGTGMLRYAPYMALSLGGLAVAWAHGRAAVLLSVVLVVHTVLYLAYLDLLPVGLWRYGNFHYWKWAFPGMGLVAFLLVRDLWRWRRAPGFPLAPLALAVSVPILCVKVLPEAVPGEVPARMLVYSGVPPGYAEAYFGTAVLRDAVGPLSNIGAVRSIPVPGGMRTFAMGREIVGEARWDPPPAGWSGDMPVRYIERLGLGRPCWVPRLPCARGSNDLLPIH